RLQARAPGGLRRRREGRARCPDMDPRPRPGAAGGDDPRHRPEERGDVRRVPARRAHRPLERADGNVRDPRVQPRDGRRGSRGRRRDGPGRHDDRGRWGHRRGDRGRRRGRPHYPRVDRRRRFARVPGGEDPSWRGRAGHERGRVTMTTALTTPVIAGNWKMHKGPSETREFFRDFTARYAPRSDRTVIFFPPAISLLAAAETVADRPDLALGVQNV